MIIIKVFILDTDSPHQSYAPPKVTGLLNIDHIVSVKPYHGRSTEDCVLVTLIAGEPLIVCMTANQLFNAIEQLRQEETN